jgi:hypothetical protein
MRLFKPFKLGKAFFLAFDVAQSLHKKSNNRTLRQAILLKKQAATLLHNAPKKPRHRTYTRGQGDAVSSPHYPCMACEIQGAWQVGANITKCTELTDAQQRAVELVTEAWFKERHSLPVVN